MASISVDNLTSSMVAQALAAGIHHEIQESLEKELMNIIAPKIKQLSANIAKEIVDRANINIVRDFGSDKFITNISFNGDVFK